MSCPIQKYQFHAENNQLEGLGLTILWWARLSLSCTSRRNVICKIKLISLCLTNINRTYSLGRFVSPSCPTRSGG